MGTGLTPEIGNDVSLFAPFRQALIGKRLSHAWNGYGSAYFLEFGDLSEGKVRRDGRRGNPRGEMAVDVECSWRIEDAVSIVCGSSSDNPIWQQTFDALIGCEVVELSLHGRIPEIDVAFSNGQRLVSFMTESGQPHWNLVDRTSGAARWLSVRRGRLVTHDGTLPGD